MAQIPRCCDSGIGQAATALIRPLAWEPPYALEVALEKAKRQKDKQTHKQKQTKKLDYKTQKRRILGLQQNENHQLRNSGILV